MSDPRLFQIGTLAALLGYGIGWLGFDVTPGRVVILIGSALATQCVCDRLVGDPRPLASNGRSALISALSLCLLLRTNFHAIAALAAFVTIASKSVVRIGGKHIFNPTNAGLVTMLLVTDRAWVSPGQWGAAVYLALLFACAGAVVVRRAARSDVTVAFIVVYCALIFSRSAYLGEPTAIPLHRLESGSLLLFTFFMISDPKTTPDSRAGRLLFAALVAFIGWYVQFRLFRTNGLLWSLAACAPLVPVIDRVMPGPRYVWAVAPPRPPAMPAPVSRAA